MMDQEILIGSVIGDERVLSLEELARACRAADLRGAFRTSRLQRDFGASMEAPAVMLDLLDEIERLRARLKRAGLNEHEDEGR